MSQLQELRFKVEYVELRGQPCAAYQRNDVSKYNHSELLLIFSIHPENVQLIFVYVLAIMIRKCNVMRKKFLVSN